MRKVVAYELVSLDGVAESPSGFVFDFDEVMYENLARVIGAQDAVLLGRGMYDEWVAYWQDSDYEPFASFINGVHKYVVTSSTLSKDWQHTSVVGVPLDKFIAELKGEPGGDIGVHGSIELFQSMLRAGLVDELRLVVAPTIAGQGKRLFERASDMTRLDLINAMSTPSGSVLMDYAVRR